jgi:hypothetical protein
MSVLPPPVFISMTISCLSRTKCQLRSASDYGSHMFSTVPRSVRASKILSGFVSFDRLLGVILRPVSLLVIALTLPPHGRASTRLHPLDRAGSCPHRPHRSLGPVRSCGSPSPIFASLARVELHRLCMISAHSQPSAKIVSAAPSGKPFAAQHRGSCSVATMGLRPSLAVRQRESQMTHLRLRGYGDRGYGDTRLR